METIPEEYKATIKKMVEADPEVAQATCDIPHSPTILLSKGSPIEGPLPYCGCFVGVYAWMQECKYGEEAPIHFSVYGKIEKRTEISQCYTSWLANWCNTEERDRAAVEYAMSLLEN